MAWLLIRALRSTMRLRHVGREPLEARERAEQPSILAFWHGRLLLMPYCYRRGRIAILISRHRDGELIARTMGWFGHRSIRGSSTRGGAAALRESLRLLRQGWDLGFTPDGPRGPREKVQMGVILAARMGRVPIVPVAFAARPARRLSSWDRFLVPLPFSRGVFLYGVPMEVPHGAGPEDLERYRAGLEAEMQRLTSEADRSLEPRLPRSG
jgi:lysophospholipid acyltransferase (LPLAT)-like uncharacterized protein